MRIKNIDLKCLKISSVLFLISILTNKYIFVSCTILWIANIIWCMHNLMLSSNMSIDKIVKIHNENTKEMQSKNKIKGFIFSLALPMCAIGCIMITLLLVSILIQ